MRLKEGDVLGMRHPIILILESTKAAGEKNHPLTKRDDAAAIPAPVNLAIGHYKALYL